MIRTVEEVEADLQALYAARLRLSTGKSVKSLTIGSNDMQRRYSYSEITLKVLNMEITRVEAELASMTNSDDNLFGKPRHHYIDIQTGNH